MSAQDPGARQGHDPPGPALRIEHLHASPGGRPVLHDVDLAVEAGEVVGILGRSGAGKTLLLELAAGIRAPERGRVRVGGRVPGPPPGACFPRLGYAMAFPERQFFEDTVDAEVRVGLDRAGWPAGEAPEVATLLRRVGFEDPDALGDRSPWTLSGGERRRVAVAAILAQGPRVLLLDEPTAGLDPRGGEDLGRALGAAAADGVAILVAGHDLRWMATICDRLVAIDAGAAHPVDLAIPMHRDRIQRIGYPLPPEWTPPPGRSAGFWENAGWRNPLPWWLDRGAPEARGNGDPPVTAY